MRAWTMVFLSMALWGCGSVPKVERLPDSADAREEVRNLQSELTAAQRNHTDIVAPYAWQNSSRYFNKAQEGLADADSNRSVLRNVAKSRAWLKQAKESAEMAMTSVPDLIDLRQDAMDSRAPDYASREWKEAEQEFRDYAWNHENRPWQMRETTRAKLRSLYMTASIASLQNYYLGDARAAIHYGESKKGDSLVPHVYENAIKSLKTAENYIAQDRTDLPGIEKLAKKATLDAQKLARVTDLAVQIHEGSPEEVALQLDRIKLNNRAMAGAVDERAFEQKFEQGRRLFAPSEAEVYKQGNNLLIRLKGIEFPVGRADLPPDSFSLVSKVGTVIKNFGNAKVRIEGHTDSTGGEKVNQELSEKRADAVRAYLTANSGLNMENIEVIGEGFSRPLASNKSAEGRAQNRRVDVVITPENTPAEPQIKQAQ